jgi:hypothetical protein
MQELTITLSVETLNAAIAALAKLPYEFSQPHIDAIRARATAAMNQEPTDEKVGTTD